MTLKLYNSLTRQKEEFKPLDAKNVRMYVCGPTVYARPHLGNARSVVVYDVLFRLLRHLYGEKHVTYARNITDVDDKIIVAAKERGIPIQQLTQEVTAQFHEDMAALNCLPPTKEPRATEHIAAMIAMIQQLIAHGNAYAAERHVLFDTTSTSSNWQYGMLSHRTLDEMIAGARVEVAPYKKNPGDFVLWKPAEKGDDASAVFDSPWGKGRPGWHIECSAMATKHLGETFDIHGGGADLMFPHHENEIAQSRCAHPHSEFARTWVHNGFLTVNGEKMAKSAGNFITVRDLLDQGVHGEVIRFALLSSKYNEPLNWTEKLVSDAKKQLDFIYRTLNLQKANDREMLANEEVEFPYISSKEYKNVGVMKDFCDDLNIPGVLSKVRKPEEDLEPSFLEKLAYFAWTNEEERKRALAIQVILETGAILGLFQVSPDEWFKDIPVFFSRNIRLEAKPGEITSWTPATGVRTVKTKEWIEEQISIRLAAKKAKNFVEADRIRDELKAQGIILEDRPDGTTYWRRA